MPSLKDAFERKQNNFNYMRLLAALSVIIGHASFAVKSDHFDFFTERLGGVFIGGLAVDLFFVLSGFLVAASVMDRGALYYAGSRVLRIFPALIVCMAVSAFLIGPLVAPPGYHWRDAWRYFVGNATLTSIHYAIPGVFEDQPVKVVNGSIWSVFDEVRLYLYLLVAYALGFLRTRSVFNWSFVCLIGYSYFGNNGVFVLFPGETDRHAAFLFCVGVFYWINRDQIPINPLLAFVAIFALAAAKGTDKWLPVYDVAVPYLVFSIGFSGFPAWPRRLGDYSYGIYLYGWPSQQLVLHLHPAMTMLENQVYGCALATAFAVASWHLIERPSLGFKRRLFAWLHRVPSRVLWNRRAVSAPTEA